MTFLWKNLSIYIFSREKKSKRKRKSRYEEEEERNYEEEYQQTRGKPEADVRFLLPIKSKKQLIQRCVEVEKADKGSSRRMMTCNN